MVQFVLLTGIVFSVNIKVQKAGLWENFNIPLDTEIKSVILTMLIVVSVGNEWIVP